MSIWSADPSPKLLRYFRKLQGFTLKQASELTGIAPNRISDHENGKHKPTGKSLEKYAKAYKRDITDFFEVDISTVKTLATVVITDYFADSEYSKDRKASIASHLLIQLPDAPPPDDEDGTSKPIIPELKSVFVRKKS